MALEIKLNQKLSQSLVMTPQLQQAIKLLQLGRSEYLEVIEKELLENPILEDAREEFQPSDNKSFADSLQSMERDPNASGEFSSNTPQETLESSKIQIESDIVSYFDLYADSQGSGYGNSRRSEDEDLPPIEATVSKREGLTSHLLWQLRTATLSVEEQEIAYHIIGNLDKNGYFIGTPQEIAEKIQFPESHVEAVLSLVQELDPPGIGARDLRECLLIQLDQMGLRPLLAGRIVEKHLDKLETRRYEQIAKEEKVEVDEVYQALRMIQRLEPRPGRGFVDEEPIYITPDLYVKKVENEWVVSLNEAGMPKLRLSPRYRELLTQAEQTPAAERDYIQDRLRSAAWLIKSVVQRQRTIHRVAEAIVRVQKEFLEQGVSAMRPLVLREIAQEVGMHESTISRVTTNKFIHTPHGVFELKYFFSSGLHSQEGDVSSESVKERIRELVSDENLRSPLSDQQLADKLKGEGIDIARRTVAKYREMSGILSSSRRKKVF